MEKNNKSFKNIFTPKNNTPVIPISKPFTTYMNKKTILMSCVLILLLIVIIIIIIYAVRYYKKECYEKKTFINYLFDYSNNDICIKENKPIPIKQVPLPPVQPKINILPISEKEVFHIANQDYTYDQSKCKCESYGARLATKAEVIDAYNKGANWCTYGWTEKQSAYYPVQQCDWDKINEINQRLPNNEKKYCGLPGINGGYFANPNIKFGVNCFGIKPKGQLNKPKNPYCPPMNFCKLETNFEAANKLDTDEIVGFNNDKWSTDTA